MTDSNVLNSSTIVMGYFEGAQICFTIGDCQRKESHIKAYNIRNIEEEEHPTVVPTVLCVSDARLTLASHTKADIFGYFNVVTSPISSAPKRVEIKKSKKEQVRKPHAARR